MSLCWQSYGSFETEKNAKRLSEPQAMDIFGEPQSSCVECAVCLFLLLRLWSRPQLAALFLFYLSVLFIFIGKSNFWVEAECP